MGEPLVLALGHRFPSLDIERGILAGIAHVVDGNVLTDEERSRALSQAEAVMLGTQTRLRAEEIDRMERCRIIVRYGVGVDNVDVEQAVRRGILVANVPNYCVDEVSDHALALLLAANRRLLAASAAALRGQWGVTPVRGVERLSTQIVGVVGMGRIGRSFTRKVRPLVRQVIAYDPAVPAEEIRASSAEPVAFEELLSRSDYISIHCPLTPQTRHLFGDEAFRRMKPTAWLINTARGEIVDEKALLAALRNGQIGGAALDVLTDEPPDAGHPLLGLENVIITPHVAYYSVQAMMDLQRLAAEQVRLVLTGQPPLWPVVR